MVAKDLDIGDNVLARTIANQILHSQRMQAIRGCAVVVEKWKGV